MRSLPDVQVPQLTEIPSKKPLFELNLKTVTPVFGGAAEKGKADPSRAVNGKLIRGHLRFWWRACKAGQFSSTEELFKAEEEIWGSTDKPSAVDVVVKIVRSDDRSIADLNDELSTLGNLKKAVNYVLFPFSRETGLKVITSLEFQLKLYVPEELRNEVEAALWAWIAFGGIGARTRRGCGTLYCTDSRFRPGNNPQEWICDNITRFVSACNNCPDVPKLQGARFLCKNTEDDPVYQWAIAVNTLYTFRQCYPVAREKSNQGKSKWPEADTIRQSFEKRRVESSVNCPFPRADLGLPIMFEFYTDNGKTPKQLLQGSKDGRRRMASPIIAKALPLNETKAFPLVVLLNTPHVWDCGEECLNMEIMEKNIPSNISEYLIDCRRVGPGGEGLEPMKGQASAREAFLLHAQDELKCREVELK